MLKNDKPVEQENSTTRTEKLLDFENALALQYEVGITTCIFLAVDSELDVVSLLRKRVHEICQLNPWLCGKLIRKKGRVHIRYAAHPSEQQTHKLVVKEATNKKLMELHPRDSSVEHIMRTVGKSKAQLPMAITYLTPGWKRNAPLTRFTLVQTHHKEEEGKQIILLIPSLCHLMTDGYGFHRIVQMLSLATPLETLRFGRNQALSDKCEASFPPEFSSFGKSKVVLFKYMLRLLRASLGLRKTGKVMVFEINQELVSEAKAQSSSMISTNDILTCSFAEACGHRLLGMVINLRGRIQDVTNDLVGNYEGVAWYDPESYDEPQKIRKSLETFPHFETFSKVPMPRTSKELWSADFGFITNWCFGGFTAEFVLQGGEETLLNLPIYDNDLSIMEVCIPFRMKPGKIGVLYLGVKFSKEQLLRHGAPLGKAI